jgi:hypothetical protein
VRSQAAAGRIEAEVAPPSRDPWAKLALRLRHPEGKAMQRVTVNGAPCHELDATRETIILRPGAATYRVVVEY